MPAQAAPTGLADAAAGAVKLYYSPGACSLGAHIALEEAGAAYEVQEVAVHRGETLLPSYLAINPHGRVPALAVGSTILTENCAVLLYIARAFPAAGLLPGDPLHEAACLSFMSWIASTVHPTYAHIVKPQRFVADEATHEPIRAAAREQYWSFMREIDARLAAAPWVMGDRFTLCDANLLPFWGFARRIRLPMAEVANFTAWKERMLARPAILRVLQRENSLLLGKRD